MLFPTNFSCETSRWWKKNISFVKILNTRHTIKQILHNIIAMRGNSSKFRFCRFKRFLLLLRNHSRIVNNPSIAMLTFCSAQLHCFDEGWYAYFYLYFVSFSFHCSRRENITTYIINVLPPPEKVNITAFLWFSFFFVCSYIFVLPLYYSTRRRCVIFGEKKAEKIEVEKDFLARSVCVYVCVSRYENCFL